MSSTLKLLSERKDHCFRQLKLFSTMNCEIHSSMGTVLPEQSSCGVVKIKISQGKFRFVCDKFVTSCELLGQVGSCWGTL